MQKAIFKYGKFGSLPGDIPKRFKIAMLENRLPIKVADNHIITVKDAKQYCKELRRQWNRRFRKQEIPND